MKYTIHLALLLAMACGIASADVVSVNFNALGGPINIGQNINGTDIVQNSHAIDEVTFSYEPDSTVLDPLYVASALCGFDVANGLGQIAGQPTIPGCVGAQVDQSGIFGSTDGSLIMRFGIPAYSLNFAFSFLTYAGLPVDQMFNVSATFLMGGIPLADPYTVASVDGTQPTPEEAGNLVLISVGNFSFSTPGDDMPFDTAVFNFTPHLAYDYDNQTFSVPYGQTTFQIDGPSFSYGEVPEPGSLALFLFGGLAIGTSLLMKRKL
jgi:hypothetical protein